MGWSAFEDLGLQIMRVVLGETCTRFRPGRDGGRDGWYQGLAAGKLATENGLAGKFIIQCKHTSEPTRGVTKATFEGELRKVEKLARQAKVNYVALTNGRLRGDEEESIRDTFECIDGVVGDRDLPRRDRCPGSRCAGAKQA